MPKRVKKPTKPKRPSTDPNLRAQQLMAEHMGKVAMPMPVPVPASVSAYMKAIGAKGGTASGAKRMEMPKKVRQEVSRKGGLAKAKAAKSRQD